MLTRMEPMLSSTSPPWFWIWKLQLPEKKLSFFFGWLATVSTYSLFAKP